MKHLYKENFHTHTTYCDGKNTPSEMIEKAIELGFDALGFSGHAYFDFPCGWCMTKDGTKEYINEINALKKEYADKIKIYCGTESDYFSDINPYDYDYIIGSVHYLKVNDEYLQVDSSAEKQFNAADKYFGGSIYGYAEKYYEFISNIVDVTKADIIGHFDLVTKFNEGGCLFSTKEKAYRKAMFGAIDKLLPYGKPFEINTGAIARGKRKTPYPSLEAAEYINSHGGCFVVTSDCHNRDFLDYAYDMVKEMYGKLNIVRFADILG